MLGITKILCLFVVFVFATGDRWFWSDVARKPHAEAQLKPEITTLMPIKIKVRRLVVMVALLAQSAFAADVKLGLSIGVDGEGFLFNPIVTKINVTGVEPQSLAAKAGIVTGDEITSIEGISVKGRRANELKAYLHFNAGESRTLVLRHADGSSFEAKLLKPKE